MGPSSARLAAAGLLLVGLPVAGFLYGRPGDLPPADFTLVLAKEAGSIDPAHAISPSDGLLVNALFEGLTRLDPVTLEAKPAAAAAFELAADGRTITFRLRDEARWSDGRPLLAEDFAYAWRRLLDPGTGSANGDFLRPIEGATPGAPDALRVHADAPRVLVVRLREPCAYFPSLAAHFALAPVRRDVVERHGARWTEPGRIVSNGPYALALRRLRDRARLAKNPHWHGAGGVALSVIDALAVDASATALNLFLTGDVDWVNRVPPLSLPHLRGRPELRVSPMLATNLLRMNVQRPALADMRVRRAIDRAIDRVELTTYVYREGERPAHSFVPDDLPGYVPAHAPRPDEREARALLAAAGYPDGQGFPELELLFVADEAARRAAEAIAARLRSVLGVRLRPVPQEAKVAIDSQRTLRYDLALASWVGDYPDPTTFLDVFRAGSPNNRTGWADAEYDALLDRAAAAEPAARAALLAQAEARLLEVGPIAAIAVRGQANLVQPWIEGFTTNLLDLHPLDRLRRLPEGGAP